MRHWNLLWKNTVLLGAITVTVLLSVVLCLLHYEEESLKSTISQGLDGRAQIIAHAFDLFLQGQLRDCDAIAASLPVKAISQGNLSEGEAYLKQMQGIFPAFRNGIFVLDKQGKLLVSYPSHREMGGESFAFREYYQRTVGEQKGVVGLPYMSQRNREVVLAVTAPVRDSHGQILAIVGSSMDPLDPQALGAFVQQRFRNTGYAYIFNTKRQLLLHPEKDRLLTSVDPGKNRLMEAALKGFEGSGETVNSKGVPMLMGVRRIPNTDWMVAIQLPQKEAYAPIAEARSHRRP